MNRKLRTEVEHLEARVDNLRDDFLYTSKHLYEKVDKLRENSCSSDVLWHNFNDVLAWSLRFDKKSNEYKRLCSAGWKFLDLYLQTLVIHTDFMPEKDELKKG